MADAVVQTPVEAPQTQAVPSVQPERRKVKIDGNEEEIVVDDVLKDYQKYKSSEKRFQEAANLRKEAQQKEELVNSFLSKAQKGDLTWLKGLVPEDQLRGWAESELLQHIEWQNKSEVERRAIIAEQKSQALQKQIEEFTESRQKEATSQVEAQAYEQIERDILEAVKGVGYGGKATPRYIRRIAEQMAASLETNASEVMPASTAAQRAFNGLKVDAKELLSSLSLEEAMELLPPHLRKAIRKRDVEDAVSQAPMMRARKSMEAMPQTRGKEKRMSSDEYFKRMERTFR